MIQLPRLPAWRLAAAALLLASGATSASAQDIQGTPPSADAAPVKVASALELSGRHDLEQATQYILQRIAEHKQRLARMDSTETFFRQSGDNEKVRLVAKLRERELKALQMTLEEYNRLLGDKDFDRVITAVRKRLSAGQLPGERSAEDTDSANGGEFGNPRNEYRRLAVERSRANRRAELAARMRDATSEELRRRAQAARSVPTSRPSSSGVRGGRGAGSVLPGMGPTSGGRMGQPFNPYTRQRGRP